MDEQTIAAVERACVRLVHSYARCADFGETQNAAALFTLQGLLEMPGGRCYAGREAIRKRLEEQPANQVSRHMIGNLLIDPVDADRARGFCYFTLYRGMRNDAAGPLASQVPFVVGHYDDEFERTADGWRFSVRRLTFTFRRTGPG
jgi:hypothetical protein